MPVVFSLSLSLPHTHTHTHREHRNDLGKDPGTECSVARSFSDCPANRSNQKIGERLLCTCKLHISNTNKRAEDKEKKTHWRVVLCITLDLPDHKDLPLKFPAVGIFLVCMFSD